MWMELKQGQPNPMLDAAQAISIFGAELTPEEKALEEMRGPVVAADWRDDPRFKSPKESRTDLVTMNDGEVMPRWLVEGDDAAADNITGSFEHLMRGGFASAHGQAFDTSGATKQ